MRTRARLLSLVPWVHHFNVWIWPIFRTLGIRTFWRLTGVTVFKFLQSAVTWHPRGQIVKWEKHWAYGTAFVRGIISSKSTHLLPVHFNFCRTVWGQDDLGYSMLYDGRFIIHISTSDSIITYFGVLSDVGQQVVKCASFCYENVWGEYRIQRGDRATIFFKFQSHGGK
jgi:hypothetical protein